MQLNGQQTLLVFFALSVITLPISAVEYAFSGYVKSYLVAEEGIEINNAPTIVDNTFDQNRYQSQNALRLMGSVFLTDTSNFELHYELQPLFLSRNGSTVITSGSSSTLTLGENRYRVADLPLVLANNGDKNGVLQNLDRLNLQLNYDAGDLTIGRQVISFGSARFVNPTDVFIPFGLQTLNQEYRVGIDAIRFQADLGDFSVLDTGIVIGHDGREENSALFLRGKHSVAGNDIEAMFIEAKEFRLFGGGIERALGDFGFWFEAAHVALDPEEESASINERDYERASIGVDYAINDRVIVYLEHHYNGAGSKDPQDYIDQLNHIAYEQAGVYLLGKQYLIPAISWSATPLITASASGYLNLDDDSIFLNVSMDISWTDNLHSDFGVFLTSGDKLEWDSAQQQVSFESEYGGYPISAYASMRYYF